MEQAIISGVAAEDDEAKITIEDVPDRPGIAATIFRAVADEGASLDMIVQNVARDGKAAIESLKSHAPQVVILDLLMPEMDGFAVVEQMRAAPAWQGIPIVVVTARELTPIERDNLMSRVDEIIQKGGHSLGELGDIIRKTIARHSAVAS